jgi:hypothetical protein
VWAPNIYDHATEDAATISSTRAFKAASLKILNDTTSLDLPLSASAINSDGAAASGGQRTAHVIGQSGYTVGEVTANC